MPGSTQEVADGDAAGRRERVTVTGLGQPESMFLLLPTMLQTHLATAPPPSPQSNPKEHGPVTPSQPEVLDIPQAITTGPEVSPCPTRGRGVRPRTAVPISGEAGSALPC